MYVYADMGADMVCMYVHVFSHAFQAMMPAYIPAGGNHAILNGVLPNKYFTLRPRFVHTNIFIYVHHIIYAPFNIIVFFAGGAGQSDHRNLGKCSK